jgi:hypothetical protein
MELALIVEHQVEPFEIHTTAFNKIIDKVEINPSTPSVWEVCQQDPIARRRSVFMDFHGINGMVQIRVSLSVPSTA